jgi:betaine-aldehyde dehydrogenase
VVPSFTDDAEGPDLANDIRRPAASAWTSDVFRAQRASAGIAAGCVWINDRLRPRGPRWLLFR